MELLLTNVSKSIAESTKLIGKFIKSKEGAYRVMGIAIDKDENVSLKVENLKSILSPKALEKISLNSIENFSVMQEEEVTSISVSTEIERNFKRLYSTLVAICSLRNSVSIRSLVVNLKSKGINVKHVGENAISIGLNLNYTLVQDQRIL